MRKKATVHNSDLKDNKGNVMPGASDNEPWFLYT